MKSRLGHIFTPLLFIGLWSCQGPCLDEQQLEQEVYFHYMALSTTNGGGRWEVSIIEEIGRNSAGDSCMVELVVSGVYSNHSLPEPEPARMFSDSLTLVTYTPVGNKGPVIKYRQ